MWSTWADGNIWLQNSIKKNEAGRLTNIYNWQKNRKAVCLTSI